MERKMVIRARTPRYDGQAVPPRFSTKDMKQTNTSYIF
jgi:hypothetical protein